MIHSRTYRYTAWFALLLVGAGSAALRFLVIESQAITHQCNVGPAPFWCGGLQALIMGFVHGGYGYAALAAAALALLWRHPFSAWLAAALGVFALNLYCYEAGALALLIGCLSLLRQRPAQSEPLQPHRQRERQIQPEP